MPLIVNFIVMKKSLLLSAFLLQSLFAFPQQIVFTPKQYIGGYNVSCKNRSDGEIRATVVWEAPPYTYQWSTGSFNHTIYNASAGQYILTVVNSLGQTITDTINLIEPESLDAFVYLSDYSGSNISGNGLQDGEILLETYGGSPDYTFLWSNGSHESRISNLGAGTYSVTITDRNACTKALSRTLTEPQVLQITGVTKSNFNGFNTSCESMEDGWAEVTVTGGTTPYTYRWSNGSLTKKAENLNAGSYQIEVTDRNNVKVVANVSLNQPAKLSVGLNTPVGTNGYHISCFQCANGTAIASPTGGISPYLFYWSTGASTNSISNLNRGEYRVTVTDVNGCAAIEEFAITEPEREDWAMAGNSNINSNINYLGTTDSNSFGLRTNSIERFKIAANGEIKLSKYASPNSQILSVDQDGVITPITIPTFPSCTGTVTFPWQQSPYDPTDVFSCWRRFGIGTDNPQVRLEVKEGLSRFTSAYSSLSYLEIGHDGGPGGGGSAMINNVGTGDLLINYNNSKNVKICTVLAP